jgi:hypothetical protein
MEISVSRALPRRNVQIAGFCLVAKGHVIPFDISGKFKGEPLRIVVMLNQNRLLGRCVSDLPRYDIDRKARVGVQDTLKMCHFLPRFLNEKRTERISPFVC